ncbi:MAG: DUF2088 domain-containing protein [Candidatus Latescibacteria bacterium]|nr:DUF2088 domain-containing protein [Candidatus Latescibacterota bacterium]
MSRKFAPQTLYARKGEKFLFQFGEGMCLQELPEGTRVIYPGVRADGERSRGRIEERLIQALDQPTGTPPLREKLRQLRQTKATAKIVFAFDDVSLPLPPMKSPDIRAIMMDQVERICLEEGVTDLEFICAIALHRPIRPDEFRHLCGSRLYRKYFPGRMRNYNAIDPEDNVHLGYTEKGEDVEVCRSFAEADLLIYFNVNYVAMDGGYKSYATGLVSHRSLRHNHDSQTLRHTRSLYDPPRSLMHQSFTRIGKVIQQKIDIFHIESVLDENLFPWHLAWVQQIDRELSLFEKVLMYSSVWGLKLLPHWLRLKIFWATRGPFGLVALNAGETAAVHQKTLEACYTDKIVEVEGQCDILLLAPTCIGPYTKDTYLNPLLVNTYALGYYYNMYLDGVPLVRPGGAVIVVNPLPYKWTEPTHTLYREFFEKVLTSHRGLDEFEAFQEEFAQDQRLNDLYRQGLAPAGVHGFYMYTWAAHGMDQVGKVYAVGCGTDHRGADILGWECCKSVMEAVAAARRHLGNPEAAVSYFRCPPVGYIRVKQAL